MSFIKPVLIAVLVVLTVLIIIKANRFATSSPSPQPTQKPKPRRSSPAGVDFYIVYVGRRVPVTHYPFTIGSRSDNDLVITDSTVSRKHAELFLKNGHVCLRDLGSLNGTLVKIGRAHV